jgi:hypothetical protein
MNETSTTITSTSPPMVLGVASRTLVRSRTTTRRSDRMRGWSWP